MPQRVEIQGFGTIEFPDEMSADQIKGVLDRKFGSGQQQAQPSPTAVAPPTAPSPAPGATLPTPAPSSSLSRRLIADPLVSLGKGVINVPQAAVGLLNIPTLGAAGKVAEKVGVNFEETQKILNSLYSPELQQQQREIAETPGVFGKIGATIMRPSALGATVGESLPSMFAGGAVAKGVRAAAPGFSAIKAAALGEGAVAGGQTAEQVRSQTESGYLTPIQAAISAGSGAATGILSILGGRLAKRLGIAEVDVLMAGGGTAASDQKKGVIRRVVEGAIVEGAFEELPQSAQEQIAQNLALGKPLDEGLADAIAGGLLAGMVTGGFVSGVSSGKSKQGEAGDVSNRGKETTGTSLKPVSSDELSQMVQNTINSLEDERNPIVSFDKDGRPVRQENIERIEKKQLREFLTKNQNDLTVIAKHFGYEIKEVSAAQAQNEDQATQAKAFFDEALKQGWLTPDVHAQFIQAIPNSTPDQIAEAITAISDQISKSVAPPVVESPVAPDKPESLSGKKTPNGLTDLQADRLREISEKDEESLTAKDLTTIFNLRKKLQKAGNAKLGSALRGILKRAEERGIEIVEHTGKAFDYGLPWKVVTTTPRDGVESMIVEETLAPTITQKNSDGTVTFLQHAEVIVATPVSKPKSGEPPVAPSPAVAPPTIEPQPTHGTIPVLPNDLRGAKPRYSYGPKQFELSFDNDLDRALYILAQDKPSKRDADYLRWAMSATGLNLTESQLRKLGKGIRLTIKGIAKDSTDKTIDVPSSVINSIRFKDESPTAQPPAPAPEQIPTLGPGDVIGAPLGNDGAFVPPTLEIRGPSENVTTVMESNGKDAGAKQETVSIDSLSGMLDLSQPSERARVDKLKSQMAGEDGFISRLIVDKDGNVVEGQHRLAALRELGVKEVPVIRIYGADDFIPNVDSVKEVLRENGVLKSDHRNQIVANLGEILLDENGSVADLQDYEAPKGFEKAWNAAVNEVRKQRGYIEAPKQPPAAPVVPPVVEPPVAPPTIEPHPTPDEAIKSGMNRGDYYRATEQAFREGRISEDQYKAWSENDPEKWTSLKVGDDVFVPYWRKSGKVADVGYGWIDVRHPDGKTYKQQPVNVESLDSYNQHRVKRGDQPIASLGSGVTPQPAETHGKVEVPDPNGASKHGYQWRASMSAEHLKKAEAEVLRILKLKGVENRGDGVYFVPQKLWSKKYRDVVNKLYPNFEVKDWADVTGNPSDGGYAILDRRARIASRTKPKPPQPAATTVEPIKLGLNRDSVIDPELSKLDDDAFFEYKKSVDDRLDELEKDYDDRVDEFSREDQQTLAEAQDKFSATENEAFRRRVEQMIPPDLMWELRQVAGKAQSRGKGSDEMARAAIIMDEMERQGATQEDLLSEINFKSHDDAEIFKYDLEAIREISKEISKTRPKAKALVEAPATESAGATVVLYRGIQDGGPQYKQDGRTFYAVSEEHAKVYGPNITKETVSFSKLLEADNWMKAKASLGLPRFSHDV
jgi:hypothetical protein